jgi:hypothetical protein
VGLEQGPLSPVSTIDELLGRKSSGSSLDSREYDRRDLSLWPRRILYPQILSLTSLTSGCRSLGIVRSRIQATEFFFVYGKNKHRCLFSWLNSFPSHVTSDSLSRLIGNSDNGRFIVFNLKVVGLNVCVLKTRTTSLAYYKPFLSSWLPVLNTASAHKTASIARRFFSTFQNMLHIIQIAGNRVDFYCRDAEISTRLRQDTNETSVSLCYSARQHIPGNSHRHNDLRSHDLMYVHSISSYV